MSIDDYSSIITNKSNYVYLLRCSDNSLYCGWTSELKRRIDDHNGVEGSKKGAKYTRSRRPVELAYFEQFPTKVEAMRREAEIKKMTHSEKENLVSGKWQLNCRIR